MARGGSGKGQRSTKADKEGGTGTKGQVSGAEHGGEQSPGGVGGAGKGRGGSLRRSASSVVSGVRGSASTLSAGALAEPPAKRAKVRGMCTCKNCSRSSGAGIKWYFTEKPDDGKAVPIDDKCHDCYETYLKADLENKWALSLSIDTSVSSCPIFL